VSVTCIVQARMGSTRLPGKVLMEIDGTPLLVFLLSRLAPLAVDHVVVATSDQPADDAVASTAAELRTPVVRGSEHDVLARFGQALDAYPADHVVRLTADCPLVDPAVVAAALDTHARSGADYTSNTLVRTFPDGLDVEVMTAQAVRAAVAEARDPDEREHVTPFIYRRPNRYRLRGVCSGQHLGHERWTIDTIDDLVAVRGIVEHVPNPRTAGWMQILEIAGRRADPCPGEVWLRPVCDEDPIDKRTCDASVDGNDIARISVGIHEGGLGTVRYEGPGHLRDAVLEKLRAALAADRQVCRLVEEDSPT
jgi:spore coat polysaccharide biosynthesis protein SpsF (cytidylyltransferase family)